MRLTTPRRVCKDYYDEYMRWLEDQPETRLDFVQEMGIFDYYYKENLVAREIMYPNGTSAYFLTP